MEEIHQKSTLCYEKISLIWSTNSVVVLLRRMMKVVDMISALIWTPTGPQDIVLSSSRLFCPRICIPVAEYIQESAFLSGSPFYGFLNINGMRMVDGGIAQMYVWLVYETRTGNWTDFFVVCEFPAERLAEKQPLQGFRWRYRMKM